MKLSPRLSSLALAIVLTQQLHAQTPPPESACSSAAHRQFDFWIGDWEVFTPDGKLAGRNRIERFAAGCGLEENWTGEGGETGKSLNGYSAADGKWHQTWVGSGGLVLHLAGRFAGDTLKMTGTTIGSGGATIQQELSFTKTPDGRVRQLWRSSRDQGRTWNVLFDGTYVKKGAKS